ncbi:AAA family ATPase [uncultured Chryseobacterium sp.]|uniref:AbiJ-related protein n=1 Tax=uncultured Chryseobacterium sp. TaxID=259322 RepID=UPI0025F37377|nr:AAA family ATPase [uncultured Chryseobacterium sp.]
MMLKISKKLRLDILKALLTENELFGTPNDDENIIKFLDEILNLKALPSEDARFKNAYDDAYQHLVNNNDWEYEYVLTERFNIIDNTETFIEFLNRIIHPRVRNNKDEIMKYFLIINPYLEKENLGLKAVRLDADGLIIYEVSAKEDADKIPLGVAANDVSFFVDNKPMGFFDRKSSHEVPDIFPSFVLALNDGWNDYSIVSEYALFFYRGSQDCTLIGKLKIIHFEDIKTQNVIPTIFKQLDNNFCSLGQEYRFYENIKELFGKTFKNILWALQDTAFFPAIQENFERNSNFKQSLIRDDNAERLMREVKYKIYGITSSKLYSFKYKFQPKFAENELEVDFDFDMGSKIPNRIYIIIGKNGTGKTQLVTSLPIDISKKNDSNFTPKTPLFSKVIAVSYSSFDRFEIPKKTAEFNYVYCGLKDENGRHLEEDELILRFQNSYEKISEQRRIERFLDTLQKFINKELISEFLPFNIESGSYEIDYAKFVEITKILSSGQTVLIFIITEIIANIRYDSLLIYDEPETHLHPNAISSLINTIYELSRIFESYCIIATHSPIIVQEILSKNVYVIEREGNYATIRKPGRETFGENLSTIIEDIFGNREIPKQFKIILSDLIKQGMSYEDIIKEIESDNVPVSLNTRLFLKSIIDEKS